MLRFTFVGLSVHNAAADELPTMGGPSNLLCYNANDPLAKDYDLASKQNYAVVFWFKDGARQWPGKCGSDSAGHYFRNYVIDDHLVQPFAEQAAQTSPVYLNGDNNSCVWTEDGSDPFPNCDKEEDCLANNEANCHTHGDPVDGVQQVWCGLKDDFRCAPLDSDATTATTTAATTATESTKTTTAATTTQAVLPTMGGPSNLLCYNANEPLAQDYELASKQNYAVVFWFKDGSRQWPGKCGSDSAGHYFRNYVIDDRLVQPFAEQSAQQSPVYLNGDHNSCVWTEDGSDPFPNCDNEADCLAKNEENCHTHGDPVDGVQQVWCGLKDDFRCAPLDSDTPTATTTTATTVTETTTTAPAVLPTMGGPSNLLCYNANEPLAQDYDLASKQNYAVVFWFQNGARQYPGNCGTDSAGHYFRNYVIDDRLVQPFAEQSAEQSPVYLNGDHNSCVWTEDGSDPFPNCDNQTDCLANNEENCHTHGDPVDGVQQVWCGLKDEFRCAPVDADAKMATTTASSTTTEISTVSGAFEVGLIAVAYWLVLI